MVAQMVAIVRSFISPDTFYKTNTAVRKANLKQQLGKHTATSTPTKITFITTLTCFLVIFYCSNTRWLLQDIFCVSVSSTYGLVLCHVNNRKWVFLLLWQQHLFQMVVMTHYGFQVFLWFPWALQCHICRFLCFLQSLCQWMKSFPVTCPLRFRFFVNDCLLLLNRHTRENMAFSLLYYSSRK